MGGLTVEEAADLPGLSEKRRSRQKPFPTGAQKHNDQLSFYPSAIYSSVKVGLIYQDQTAVIFCFS